MKVGTAKEASTLPKAKRKFKNTPLNDLEKQRLRNLRIRFQDIVYIRNQAEQDPDKKELSNLEDVDVVRAGLLRLEAIKSDDEFYEWMIKGRKRK
jgi:hypothetical protein